MWSLENSGTWSSGGRDEDRILPRGHGDASDGWHVQILDTDMEAVGSEI
jgi:hypothetical protein